MAEFREVMKQWRRMCDKMREQGDWCQAAICPLGGKCQFPSTTDSATVEKIVMAWAAENPEPVYPTWGEWFLRTGQVPTRDGKTNDWESVLMSRIPPDTAKKLGVRPKEG